jgi:ABC-type lipoprotein release transport system permease subunit
MNKVNETALIVSLGYLAVIGVAVLAIHSASKEGFIKGCEAVMVNMLHGFDVQNIDYVDLQKFCEDQRKQHE